jgi:TusA-related sulfurtransferase
MADIKVDREIDIRGLVCPYTFVKSKLAIEGMSVGQVLRILLDYEEAATNIPRSMKDHGHSVLGVEKTGDREWELLVRKERDED